MSDINYNQFSLNDLQNNIKTLVFNKFKTGNYFIDSIILSVLGSICSIFIFYITNNITNISNTVLDYFKSFSTKNKYKYNIIISDENNQSSGRNYVIDNVKKYFDNNNSYLLNLDKSFNYFCGDYKFTNNIYLLEKFSDINDNIYLEYTEKEKLRTIRLFSNNIILKNPLKYMNIINNFVDNSREKKIGYTNVIYFDFFINYRYKSLSVDADTLSFYKTFDGIFFPEKETLKYRLDFFLNNKQYFINKNITYKFCLLLSGIPGSGKTSTIKAIIHHTKRNVFNINLGKIVKKEFLYKIFSTQIDVFDPKSGNRLPPIHSNYCSRIFIIEELDHICDLINKQNCDNNTNSEVNIDELCDITIPDLLVLFDGIKELTGAIIIFTTNYPEKIDQRLLRPGRVDFRINFTYVTTQDMKNIILHYYKDSNGNFPDVLVNYDFDIKLNHLKQSSSFIFDSIYNYPDYNDLLFYLENYK